MHSWPNPIPCQPVACNVACKAKSRILGCTAAAEILPFQNCTQPSLIPYPNLKLPAANLPSLEEDKESQCHHMWSPAICAGVLSPQIDEVIFVLQVMKYTKARNILRVKQNWAINIARNKCWRCMCDVVPSFLHHKFQGSKKCSAGPGERSTWSSILLPRSIPQCPDASGKPTNKRWKHTPLPPLSPYNYYSEAYRSWAWK